MASEQDGVKIVIGAAITESGESWLARQLAEYTGYPAHVVASHRLGVDVALDGKVSDMLFRAPRDRIKARDASWVRWELAKCERWSRVRKRCSGAWQDGDTLRRCIKDSGHEEAHHEDGTPYMRWTDESVAGERAKFYGTQPSVLPETLPAGTHGMSTGAVDESLVLGLYGGLPCYMRASRPNGGGWGYPGQVVWSTVPVQEAKPVAASPAPEQRPILEGSTWRHRDGWKQIVSLDETADERDFRHIYTWVSDPVPAAQASGTLKAHAQALYDAGAILGDLKPEVVTCRGCSSPVTRSSWCAYCFERDGEDANIDEMARNRTDADSANVAARDRLAAFDKRSVPRQTAESKELARAHPWESWSTSGDES